MSEQNKAAGTGNAKPAPVDPGEKPSLLHPIKRIWWCVKKWASEKAAAVFGWIQEKISSLVLRAILGISMADLKAYTTALHHRMEFSKVAGTKGAAAAAEAINEQTKASTSSKSYADQAMADAQECDRNVADSAAFVKNIEAAEQSVVAEQAKAKQFLASMAAAVAAERANKQQEQAKKAAEAKQAPGNAATNAPATASPAPAAGIGPVATNAPPTKGVKKKKTKDDKDATNKPVSAAAVGKVESARSYVKKQAMLMVDQLSAQNDEQQMRLKESIAGKSIVLRAYATNLRPGEKILTEMKQHTSAIIARLDTLTVSTASTKIVVQKAAGELRTEAGDLDHAASDANQQLNWSFKSTYAALSKVA